MRKLIYRVYAISMLSENKITLFEEEDEQIANQFARDFDGGEKEIFVEKVYRLVGSTMYPSNIRSSNVGSEL